MGLIASIRAAVLARQNGYQDAALRKGGVLQGVAHQAELDAADAQRRTTVSPPELTGESPIVNPHTQRERVLTVIQARNHLFGNRS